MLCERFLYVQKEHTASLSSFGIFKLLCHLAVYMFAKNVSVLVQAS